MIKKEKHIFSENAIRILREKYLKCTPSGEIKETPSQMFKRIAKGLSDVEKKYNKTDEECEKIRKDFENVLSKLQFIPAGRTMASVNNKYVQRVVSNCVVLHIQDDLRDIFNTLSDAAVLQQNGSGIGFPLHLLRPAGEKTIKTMGLSSGPVSFMELYDKAFCVVKQRGRRGANMATMRVDHPDILEFITCKAKEDVLNNFNISVLITDKFIEQVKLDKELPKEKRATWICEFKGKKYKPRRLTKDKYNKVKEIYEYEYSALDIWEIITKQAWSNGEPGVIFIDTVNKNNPIPGLGDIQASNPCVTGDTWVMTTEGLRRVEDLQNRYFFPIVNGKIYGQTNFKRVGEKPRDVYEVTTEHGFSIKATQEHKLMLNNANWREVKDIKPGNKLKLGNHEMMKQSKMFGLKEHFEEGYMLGMLLFNPGKNIDKQMFYINNDGTHNQILDKILNFNLIRMMEFNKIYSVTGDIIGYKTNSDYFEILYNEYTNSVFSENSISKSTEDFLYRKTFLFQKGLIQSMIDSGYVEISIINTDGSKQPKSRIVIKSNVICFKHIQRMLYNFGILSKEVDLGTKSLVIINYHSKRVFCKQFTSYIERKQKKIKTLIDILDKQYETIQTTSKEYGNYYSRVTDVKKLEQKMFVYDCTVPGIHCYDGNGFINHNCGEQMLHDGDACNLGSINLEKMCKDDNSDVDWDRLKHTIRVAVRMLDNVIDLTKFPVNRVNKMFKRNRRIGLGFTGLADLLMKLKIPYNSPEGRNIASRIMKTMTEEGRNASESLAVEKGCFPNYEKSIWFQKKRLQRNAAITTIAPVGTSSMIADVCSGIEPYFMLSFTRYDSYGKPQYTYVNKHLSKFLEEHTELDSSEIISEIKKNNGSCKSVDQISKELRDVFSVSQDIAPEDHVKMLAQCQQYCDNSISKTVNLKNSATVSDVSNIFMLAYESGCKGCTVYRDGSRSIQILSSDKEEKNTNNGVELKKNRKNEDGKKRFITSCKDGLCEL